MATTSVPSGPPSGMGLAIFGPPTSLTDLVIWFVEKVVESLPVWGNIWNAIEFNYQMNNPPSVVKYNNLIWYFHPGASDPDVPVAYETFNGSAWSSQQGCPATSTSSGPGAVVFDNRLYVFFQYNDTGQLQYLTYSCDPYGAWIWGLVEMVQGTDVIMSSCPSPVAFNNSLYVFYQGSGNDGQLRYSQSSDGVTFSSSTQVPNVGMSASPSAVVFANPSTGQDELYVFHQGEGNNCQLWYNVLDAAGNWAGDRQITSVTMWDAPVAVVYGDSIYVLYNGGSSHLFYIVSADGSTWTAPVQIAQVASAWSPSVVAFNNTIYLMLSNGGALWSTPTAPGGSSSIMSPAPNNTPASAAPGSVVFNGMIYCFTSTSSGALVYQTYSSSGWNTGGTGGTVPATMTGTPAPVLFNNNLYVFYQGGGADGALCYNYSPNGDYWDWSGQNTVPNTGMSAYPSPVVFNNELYVFHQGYADKGQIWYNVLNSSGQWAGDQEVSASAITYYMGGSGHTGNAPTAIVFNGTLYLFYIVSIPNRSPGYNCVCYNAFQDGGWSSQMTVPGPTDLEVTSPVALLPFDDGSGTQLYCVYRNSQDSGVYYVATSDPDNSASWSAIGQIGASVPPGQTPQGAAADIANWTVAAIQFVASP